MRVLRWLWAHRFALLAALVSLAGIMSRPEVLNLLPPAWANRLSVAGVVLQAIAREIGKGIGSRPSE